MDKPFENKIEEPIAEPEEEIIDIQEEPVKEEPIPQKPVKKFEKLNKPKEEKKEMPKPQPLYYAVQRNDTLILIAQKHNVTVGQIINLNRIKNPDMIYIGQVLRIK